MVKCNKTTVVHSADFFYEYAHPLAALYGSFGVPALRSSTAKLTHERFLRCLYEVGSIFCWKTHIKKLDTLPFSHLKSAAPSMSRVFSHCLATYKHSPSWPPTMNHKKIAVQPIPKRQRGFTENCGWLHPTNWTPAFSRSSVSLSAGPQNRRKWIHRQNPKHTGIMLSHWHHIWNRHFR